MIHFFLLHFVCFLSFLVPDNSIGDEGAFALSSALRINTTLTKLSLMRQDNCFSSLFCFVPFITKELGSTENKISDRGARALSEAVKANTTMTKLYLTGKIFFFQNGHCVSSHMLYFHYQGNKIAEEVKDEIKESMSPMKPFRFGSS